MSTRRPARAPRTLSAADVDRLVALFFLAWRGFAAEPDAILARDGLGRVHHRILYAVVRMPGVSVGELAATLGVTRQALHGPLADLTKRDLVDVRVSERSARERAVHATASGERLEERATGAQRQQLSRVFGQVGPVAAAGWRKVMQGLAAPALPGSPAPVGRIVADREAGPKGGSE